MVKKMENLSGGSSGPQGFRTGAAVSMIVRIIVGLSATSEDKSLSL
ncbi:hypothetical protein [Streptomyces sp. AS58]|nr:hypothetical protein [Streptomyces sp. AS58]